MEELNKKSQYVSDWVIVKLPAFSIRVLKAGNVTRLQVSYLS